MLAYVVWDARREAFVLPFVGLPIYWYSLCFAVGLYGAVVVARGLLRRRAHELVGSEQADEAAIDRYLEKLSLFCMFGIIIGARLGHVIFYDWNQYCRAPLDILNLRLGGLSSHGAVLGLVLAVWRFSKQDGWPLPYLPKGKDLLDLLSVASAWAAGCIRIGNFCNQEIVGTPTSVPWAIIFASPLDAIGGVPRHPAQLYEAIVYFTLFGILLFMSRKGRWATSGALTGWYLIAVFSTRSCIELVKAPQCAFDTTAFHMGQVLSLPAILAGLYLIVKSGTPKG